MRTYVETSVALLALVTGLVTGAVTIENRYARAVEVNAQLNNLWAKTLKLRILELELKPAGQFTSADEALVRHMREELREATGAQ